MYDPVTGRFLSADPHIQAPYDTQSYNRYTYVKNNPLKYTDPSGFFFKKIRKAFKRAVKSIGKFFKQALKAAVFYKPIKKFFKKYKWARQIGMVVASYFGGPLGAAAFSAYITHIQGGSLKDVAKSFVVTYASALIANGVAEGTAEVFGISSQAAHAVSYFESAGLENAFTIATVKAVAHGVTRVAIAKVQGQSGKGIFLSGFAGSAFASTNNNIGVRPRMGTFLKLN